MNVKSILVLVLFAGSSVYSIAGSAQGKRKSTVKATQPKPVATPIKVSGGADYLTAPNLENAPESPQPQPIGNLGIKPQRKVKVVPAPPPPGPIAPVVPPKETTNY